MAANSKIYKDTLGLYAVCGGWISRPFYGTKFEEGDLVKTHHFGGSTMAGVTVRDKPGTHNFKSKGQYEVWVTTGITNMEYKDKSYKVGSYNSWEEYLKLNTEWYRKNEMGFNPFAKGNNDKFEK